MTTACKNRRRCGTTDIEHGGGCARLDTHFPSPRLYIRRALLAIAPVRRMTKATRLHAQPAKGARINASKTPRVIHQKDASAGHVPDRGAFCVQRCRVRQKLALYSSVRSFAIWTALVAAPLRIWSPQHQKVIPRVTSGLEMSRRTRPTQIRS